MAKSVQQLMTRGVEGLGLSPTIMQTLFSQANKYRDRSPFLCFIQKGNQVEISDGNDKKLGSINVTLPTKIWIIFDDYGDRWVATALLPSEY